MCMFPWAVLTDARVPRQLQYGMGLHILNHLHYIIIYIINKVSWLCYWRLLEVTGGHKTHSSHLDIHIVANNTEDIQQLASVEVILH